MSTPTYTTHAVDPALITNCRAGLAYGDAAHSISVGEVIDPLLAAGMAVYAGGGAPRDWLLGEVPRDLDLYVDRGLDEVLNVLREAFPDLDPVHRTRPDIGFMMTWGRIDLGFLRSYKDLRNGDAWTTAFPPRSDLRENALLHDFSINAFYYDFRRALLVDPLSCGLEDLNERRLRLVAHETVLAATSWPSLRIAAFLCRGYHLTENTRAHLAERADRDLVGMSPRLSSWVERQVRSKGIAVEDFVAALAPWIRTAAGRELLAGILGRQ